MPISGLVITLRTDRVAEAQAAIESIEAHPEFECGPPPGPHTLPAVLETPDRTADRAAWDWLNDLPGVRHVDVVFIHFDEDEVAPEWVSGVGVGAPIEEARA